MRASFLPVVERELRVKAKRWTTFLFRVGAAGCAMLFALILLQPGSFNAGQTLFITLYIFAFIFSLLAGAAATADSLSEERREGTLGLLFLTNLKGVDVVLGKMAATSIISVYALISIFPVLALAFFAGGVTGGELLRAVWVILNSIFFSLSCGLWVSSRSYRQGGALVGSFALVFLFTLGLPLIDFSVIYGGRWPSTPCFSLASPAFTASLAFESTYRNDPQLFWTSLTLIHCTSWILLLFAGWHSQKKWELTADQWGRLGLGERRIEAGAVNRLRLLSRHPVLWAATRTTPGVFSVLVVMAVCGTTLGWIWMNDKGSLGVMMFNLISVLCRLALLAFISWICCRWIADSRRIGAMELLLTTPLKLNELLAGYGLALRRLLFWPIIAGVGLELFSFANRYAFYFRYHHESPSNHLGPAAGAIALSLLVFLADILALAWFGTWQALVKRRPTQAAMTSFLLVILGPYCLAVFLLPFGVPIFASWSSMHRWAAAPLFFILKDAAFIFWARHRLKSMSRSNRLPENDYQVQSPESKVQSD